MEIREYIKNFPHEPGCYVMKDKSKEIIYIGKAKDIKNRVSSYFSGEQSIKTQQLLKEIEMIEYIVTKNEAEAFILENEMIKTHQPKYNILLKDDKTYPYIHITNEEHPRILISREIKKGKGQFFGPYPNSKSAREVVDLLNKLYPLRKCNVLPKKECLYYHMGQCLAPCILKVTDKDYKPILNEVISFLKGDYEIVIDALQTKMQEASDSLQFELAQEHRDSIKHIRQLLPKQHIVLPDKVNRDVWGWYAEGDVVSIQVLHARQGAIVEREVYHYEEIENMEEAIQNCLMQFYQKHLIPKELLMPNNISKDLLEQSIQTKILQPQKGDKKKLVDMAIRNVEHAFKMERIRKESKEQKKNEGMNELKNLINLEKINRIEIFDNAHMQGAYAVSGVIVYQNGSFQKKEYRKFRLKQENGRDDLASMKEVVHRRYSRILQENGVLPDLIVIDGGKTQWHTVKLVIDQLGIGVPVISLMKDDKHRTNGLIDTKGNENELKRSSYLYRLAASWQEEVHRFVITYFRSLQQKEMKASTLDNIKGVGKERKKQLLQHFKSIEKIKRATVNELKQSGIPQNTAETVWNYYHPEEE